MNQDISGRRKKSENTGERNQSVSGSVAAGDVIQIQHVGGNVSITKDGLSHWVVPKQLPPVTRHFAGRVAELDLLTSFSGTASQEPGAIVIAALSGTAGIGKTTLAVRWAHEIAESFPDGQLFANLHGFGPYRMSMTPANVIRGFLEALGVSPEKMPTDLDAQAGLYRSLVSDRRILVVLDNVRDAEQVRPLLPGTSTALVVVTSRNQLSSLVATEGADLINLDLLTHEESKEMLERRLGSDRTHAEPEAINQIIDLCARLPLALAIGAARAAARPRIPLTAIASDLRDHHALGSLDGGDPSTNIRSVFSWSYDALAPGAARLFRLLGVHPGPDISIPAASSLAEVSPERVRIDLAELAYANMISEGVSGRYAFHDLIHGYAAELAEEYETSEDRQTAKSRAIDYYLRSGYTAALLLNPRRDSISIDKSYLHIAVEEFPDHEQASAWFTAERSVLLALIRDSGLAQLHDPTWKLAWTLTDFLDRRCYWQDQIEIQQIALAAAQKLADESAIALTHRTLARAYARLGLYNEANTNFSRALDIFNQLQDGVGQAHTHHSIGITLARQGLHADALSHARRAYDLYLAFGHRVGQAEALNSIGWYHAQLGQFDQGLASCETALRVYAEIGGHRSAEAATWDTMGYIHHHAGRHLDAIACYERALSLHRAEGDRFWEAAVLGNIAETHFTVGKLATAREMWQRALAIFEEIDHVDAESVRARLLELKAQLDQDVMWPSS